MMILKNINEEVVSNKAKHVGGGGGGNKLNELSE